MRAKALIIGTMVLLALLLAASTALAVPWNVSPAPRDQRHGGGRVNPHRYPRCMDGCPIGDDAMVAV